MGIQALLPVHRVVNMEMCAVPRCVPLLMAHGFSKSPPIVQHLSQTHCVLNKPSPSADQIMTIYTSIVQCTLFTQWVTKPLTSNHRPYTNLEVRRICVPFKGNLAEQQSRLLHSYMDSPYINRWLQSSLYI